MLNGLFLFEAIVWELCKQRSIPVVTYERGFILDSFVFARDEPAGLTNLDRAWPRWADRELTGDESRELDAYLEDRLWGRRTADRYLARREFRRAHGQTHRVERTAPDQPRVGLGCHRSGSRISSIVDWITSTIRIFAARPSDELVVRVHPAEIKLPGRESRQSMEDSIRAQLPSLPPNVVIVSADDPTSSYSLMDSTDFGLVYSSTTGLEMALRGKPVVVAAQTHYSGKGFTLDAQSPTEYEEFVTRLLDAPTGSDVDVALARRYAYLFFFPRRTGSRRRGACSRTRPDHGPQPRRPATRRFAGPRPTL